MGPVENTTLASQLMYKMFKVPLIIRLKQFKDEWKRLEMPGGNGTPLEPLDFLLHFSKKLTFFISPTVMFSG